MLKKKGDIRELEAKRSEQRDLIIGMGKKLAGEMLSEGFEAQLEIRDDLKLEVTTTALAHEAMKRFVRENINEKGMRMRFNIGIPGRIIVVMEALNKPEEQMIKEINCAVGSGGYEKQLKLIEPIIHAAKERYQVETPLILIKDREEIGRRIEEVYKAGSSSIDKTIICANPYLNDELANMILARTKKEDYRSLFSLAQNWSLGPESIDGILRVGLESGMTLEERHSLLIMLLEHPRITPKQKNLIDAEHSQIDKEEDSDISNTNMALEELLKVAMHGGNMEKGEKAARMLVEKEQEGEQLKWSVVVDSFVEVLKALVVPEDQLIKIMEAGAWYRFIAASRLDIPEMPSAARVLFREPKLGESFEPAQYIMLAFNPLISVQQMEILCLISGSMKPPAAQLVLRGIYGNPNTPKDLREYALEKLRELEKKGYENFGFMSVLGNVEGWFMAEYRNACRKTGLIPSKRN